MKLSRPRLLTLILACLVILLAWANVLGALSGLEIRRLSREGVPMLFLAPKGAENAPAVLVAHGFGGSKQLMLAYGHVLAHAGYAVLLWDFAGHAANATPLDLEGDTLQDNLDTAYEVLLEQPEVNSEQVALLGHSMGSGAVMTAGIRHPERYAAVVAISPTGADVTETVPPNLLLQAGELEPQFAENARELLAAAGGSNDDLADGRGRAFALIPSVEHITILFSPDSHRAALNWLDQVFERESASTYHDTRIVWYLVQVVAGAVGLAAAGPWLQTLRGRGVATPVVKSRTWLVLIVAPFLATGALYFLSLLGDLSLLGGVLVGGALGIWLLLLGGFLLTHFRPSRPSRRSFLWGALLFVLLWLIVGALAQVVWLPWLLVPARLVRWPMLALFCLPWTLAAAAGQYQQRRAIVWGWWLAQSILLAAGLLLAINLIPSLFVLILVLPLFPPVIGLMTLANAAIQDPWAGGVANAFFFAWLLLAYFPLAG